MMTANQHVRRLVTALALGCICIQVAACSGSDHKPAASSTAPPPVATSPAAPTKPAAPPVEWLLSAADINTAMGATGMTVATTDTKISEDGPDVIPKNCLFAYGPAQNRIYAVSNWSAVRRQTVQEPNDDPAHMVDQTLVSFPSANDVGAFFSRSAQEWPACANHQFMHRDLRHNDETWVTGAVTNTNNMLSVTNIQQRTHGWGCQRALTVANNVAIDIAACSYTRSDAAINIASQIAAKVRAAR